MEKMHKNIVDGIVLCFLKIYSNPRTKITNFCFGNWVFGMDFNCNLENSNPYNKISIDWSLYLRINDDILTPSEIGEIFFDELNKMNTDIDLGIYDLISSMMSAFYLPYSGFEDENNFIHQKFISYNQLCLICSDEKLNNLYRNIYIKNIFYNSFFTDYLKFLYFKNGLIYFKEASLREIFVNLKRKKSSVIFNNVIEYCISFIDFLEKGLLYEKDNNTDDIFIESCYYIIFDKRNIKPYFYKNIITLIDKMYSYPRTNIGDLYNKMLLLNFIIINKRYKNYIKNYINNINIDRVNIDIIYLEKQFLKNKHIQNSYKILSREEKPK